MSMFPELGDYADPRAWGEPNPAPSTDRSHRLLLTAEEWRARYSPSLTERTDTR